ncbi:MAG: hypothetical protein IPM11_09170 [Micropruina sp.]|nr:hypothetical protein [Micropruina sp.]
MNLRLSLPRAVARFFRRHRRGVAAVLTGLGVLAALSVVAPPPAPHMSVVVAVRELPGGSRVAVDDVRRVDLPVAALPERPVRDPAVVVGRLLVAGVTRNQVLTEPSIVSGTGQADSGSVIVPLTLADTAVMALLRPGDLIDVLAVSGQSGKAGVVVEGARVIATPPQQSGVLASSSGAWILVQVPQSATTALVEAMSSARLTVALH